LIFGYVGALAIWPLNGAAPDAFVVAREAKSWNRGETDFQEKTAEQCKKKSAQLSIPALYHTS
jgi:hypothetical protein